jgi:hypothetical protein
MIYLEFFNKIMNLQEFKPTRTMAQVAIDPLPRDNKIRLLNEELACRVIQ